MKRIFLRKSLVVLLSAFTIFNTTAYSTTNSSEDDNWQVKVDPYILENMQQLGDTIPVWLWMEDIDQDAAVQKVYENTGLKESDLEVIDEPIPDQLAMSIANLDQAETAEKISVKSEFREYLETTEPARKLEAQRVDTYIDELRTVQKDMLRQKNQSIFSRLGLSENSIIKSELQAPVYIVNIAKSDIERLAKNPKVTSILYYKDEVLAPEDEYDDTFSPLNTIPRVMAASNLSRIRTETGLTGSGVKLGLVDEGKVQPNDEIDASRITYVEPSKSGYHLHSTNVARIAAGTEGVAAGASIYSSSSEYDSSTDAYYGEQYVKCLVGLSNAGVKVANMSMGIKTERTESYTALEVYTDYFVSQNKLLVVKSAGNEHDAVTSPGMAYNVITTGGFFNQGTTDQSDDVVFRNSNYYKGSGCFKPDFIADQSYAYHWVLNDDVTGTSYAAPFVTGTIALLYELRPSLAAQPEAVKAILMASCHRKVTPSSGDPAENMASGLTARQGAGAIDPYKAIAIAGSRHYGVRTLGSTTERDRIRINQPAYGSAGLNISLAWSVNPANRSTPASKTDLCLWVTNNGRSVGDSYKSDSSTEMVYITPSSTNSNYTISAQRDDLDSRLSVRYAYAFSIDKGRYQYTDTAEGVYYLKNKATGLYLTSGSSVTQQAFAGGASQQWILENGSISSVGEDKALAVGSTISGDYKKAVTSSGSGALTVIGTPSTNDHDDAVAIRDASTASILCINNNSSASGALAAWVHSLAASDNYRQWYLEPVAYQKGDVNLSGTFESEDSQMVLEYATGQRTFSRLQKFLADVNGDGTVNTTDALKVSQIVAGTF